MITRPAVLVDRDESQPYPFDVDSFSLNSILPAIWPFLAVDGVLVALVKPQFEVGKGMVGKGGIVRDTALHELVIADIENWFTTEMKWRPLGTVPSLIDGPDGNREFFIAGYKI